ncbi:hypothetical protein [Ectobacillus funiculus]|uniref:hypothetical protein n=1 Tax=Ectobacillus funiculus TaxID=137993 RepID=UPI00101C62EE|nr:hypothetical protein [Ectobacillus funiculus]
MKWIKTEIELWKSRVISWRSFIMWVITVYSKENTTLFEFDTEEEARNAFKEMIGNKILSEIVYFNDPCVTKVTV